MLHLRAATLADTHAIAAALAGVARTGDLIVLAGEMGSGKTAFAKGFAAALGVTEPVTGDGQSRRGVGRRCRGPRLRRPSDGAARTGG